MTAPAGLGDPVPARSPRPWRRLRSARLVDGIGQRQQVIVGGWRRIELAIVPDEIPAARSGQPASVLFA
jgi:hypothetical protein